MRRRSARPGTRAAPAAFAAALTLAPVAAGADLFPAFAHLETANRDNRIVEPGSGREIGAERTRVWREAEGTWRFLALRDYPGVRTILEENVARVDARIHPLWHRFEVRGADGGLLHAIRVDYDEEAGEARVRWNREGERIDKTVQVGGDAPYLGHLMGLCLRALPTAGLGEFRYHTIALAPRIFHLEMKASVDGRATKPVAGRPTECARIDLEPQLGFLLTTIAGLFSPTTNLWYAAAPPHDFCGFHGLPLPWPGDDEVWIEPTRILGTIEAPEADFPRLDSARWETWKSPGGTP